MNQASIDGWRGPGGSQPSHNSGDANNQPQVRNFAGFAANTAQQVPPQQVAAPVLPPPSYHPSAPSGGHNLPTLADLTQGASSGHHQQSQYNTHPPPSNAGHSLPGLGQSVSHQSPQSFLNREREIREMREHEMRERGNLEMQRHQEEAMLREQREHREREREQMDRMHREQQQQQQQQHPIQNHAGSIPIHQPVASKVPNTIHGPNGLLSTLNSGPGVNISNNPPSNNNPSSIFGMPVQQTENNSRPPTFLHQSGGPPAPQPVPSFMGAGPGPGPSPMPSQAALGQGQQPILNDALSYLDQVKVRFSDHPDVYNRFLDIMKDFKSQAIDTPGVIDRVSNLFSGHPSLIQGFNTFLPPGYRIECGTDDNPDAIRVTTPSGTMTQSLQSRARPLFETSNLNPLSQSSLGRPETFEQSRPGWQQQQQHQQQHAPHQVAQFSPSGRPANLPPYGQQPPTSAAEPSFDQDAANAALVHQQEQRGVSQLQNAVSVATNGNAARGSMMQISPGAGQPANPVQGSVLPGAPALPGDMKRGPVEFNHAISYVNKIKNRFAQQPEIYKQFLEILQTYQRESKPIQDVYAQVTQLFNTAPDLLEDFKQFLPESAAQAKAQAAARAAADEAMVSNVRSDPSYASGQVAQAQTPRPAAKMPPMGQFDPPSTSKESKKRRVAPVVPSSIQSGAQPSVVDSLGPAGSAQNNRLGSVQVGNANKRAKISHIRPTQPEAPLVSPTLVPQLPEPLPPLSSLPTTQEELGFFDRAKKHISNKASYTEFLKLMNLFSQDLIDKHVLLDRVSAFIGNNTDLMAWFTRFLGVEVQEETIEARVRPDPGRVNLAHCRALGPSYRYLPKRDQTKLCKGRDEMCYAVLNDVWASHPTWASEDSGFVAHRKNQYEEGLHRLEEERHDYDFHIESCQRTIQLMEPIVQQIQLMSEADRANFVLAPGLGGQSEAIPKRIIMKIYDRDRGAKVIQEMFARPTAVLPVVLSRLKQKLEEWKQSQREWEKVWREQTGKFFWKSLDHQGINAKNLDKKNFQQKTLTSEIQGKFEERKKNREAGYLQPKHQLEYEFIDHEVILDASHLILVALERDRSTYNSGEQERIAAFLKDFVPIFFGLDRTRFIEFMSDIYEKEASNGDAEDGVISDEASTTKARITNLRKADFLRRGILDRRNGKEGSVFSGSKESTPAATAMSEHDVEDDAGQDGTGAVVELADRKWIDHDFHGENPRRHFALDESYPHSIFNLYCNANVYCFFRLFETLYSRLLGIKQHETGVHEAVSKSMGEPGHAKPAIALRMIDKLPKDFFSDVSGGADYYRQIIQMCEEVISGTLDQSHLEETLRRFYMHSGWQLYTIDKLLSAITRFVMNILSSDSKDKSTDIINLFFKDRDKDETTRAQEMQYRKQVQKLVKDGEIYRISFHSDDTKTTIRVFPPEDATFDGDSLSEEAQWSYYVASYTMSDPTEGVDTTRMSPVFLKRNVAVQPVNVEDAYAAIYGNLHHKDSQSVFISPDTYKLHYGGNFSFCRDAEGKGPPRAPRPEKEKFRDKFVRNTAWMKGESEEAVDRRKAAWRKGMAEGLDQFEEHLAQVGEVHMVPETVVVRGVA